MKSKPEGIVNYLRFVDFTLDAAKLKSYRTGHHSGKRNPIRPTYGPKY